MAIILGRKPGGAGGGGAPSGPAGGDLTGTYPNPTLANDAVETAAIQNNAVTAAKVAADVATQAELDAIAAARLVGAVLFDSTLGADTATIDSGAGGFSTSFKDLRICIYSRTTQAAVGGTFTMIFNNDTGNNYDRQVLTVTNTTVAGAIALAGAAHTLSTLGASALANAFGGMVIEIPNYSGTTGFKPMLSNMVRIEDTAADCVSGFTHMLYRSTSAISRVAITAGGGSNFLAGTRMTIYGIG